MQNMAIKTAQPICRREINGITVNVYFAEEKNGQLPSIIKGMLRTAYVQRNQKAVK